MAAEGLVAPSSATPNGLPFGAWERGIQTTSLRLAIDSPYRKPRELWG